MKGLVGITGALLLTLAVGLGWLWQRAHAPWTQWQAYAEHFIQPDGRVVDITAGRRSTSEGQAYSLFFALVAREDPHGGRFVLADESGEARALPGQSGCVGSWWPSVFKMFMAPKLGRGWNAPLPWFWVFSAS